MLRGVICDHVGSQGAAPCLVVHDAPVSAEQTGWQVTCGVEPHAAAELRLVDLDGYIERDRALQDLRELLREGHRASRGAPGQPWLVEPLHAEDEAA